MRHRSAEPPGFGAPSREPTKRINLNVPESLHTRFKFACVATNRTMAREILKFVENRTEEIEQEAGLNSGAWPQPAVHRDDPRAVVERRLRALGRALGCGHPTADIDEMLGDIERGRDLR